MDEKRILGVLGGTWHDFDSFAATLSPVFEAAGYTFQITHAFESLLSLHTETYDVVLLYTCLEDQGFSEAQTGRLVQWVQKGGGLLALHAATVAAQSDPVLRALIGGVFGSHPPQFSFTVYPVFHNHPIIKGVKAFMVHDELYMEEITDSVEIQMVTIDRGVAYPMVWSRSEGKGRVVHIAMGHDREVWTLSPYQRLLLQAMSWLTAYENLSDSQKERRSEEICVV